MKSGHCPWHATYTAPTDGANTYRAIVRGGRNKMVVEGIPFEVEYLAGMADHLVALEIDAARLRYGYHNERIVNDDGQKQWIHRAQVAVVAAAHHTAIEQDRTILYLPAHPV